MLPTHVLGGMLLAAPLVRVAPELAPIGFVAGFLGGLFPDLDMYVGHRKTLHFPVCTTARSRRSLSSRPWRYRRRRPSAPPCSFSARPSTASPTCTAADWSCGRGGELRPRRVRPLPRDLDRPRQLVRYDGAVEDLALSIGLSLPLLYLLNGLFQQVVLGHARRRRRVHDDPAPSRGACGLDHPTLRTPCCRSSRTGTTTTIEAVATTTTRRSRIVNVPHNHLADRQRRRSRINRSSLAHTMSVVRLH